jgi:hypothetical protein
VYTNNAYAIDGCATFFKRSRFSLVKKYEVEFNKAALSLAENIGPEQKKPALSRLLKVCANAKLQPCVCCIAGLVRKSVLWYHSLSNGS